MEINDSSLPENNERFSSVLKVLNKVNNLVALSLQNSVDIKLNQQMASSLNKLFRKLTRLRRVDFAYCNLKGRLSTLLGGLRQAIEFLGLKDCRLNAEDLVFLSRWNCSKFLRELNLSRNNLEPNISDVESLLERLSQNVVCLSLAYSIFSTTLQLRIARICRKCPKLKVLCLTGYTPLPHTGSLEVLSIIAQNRSVQKAVIFPKVYGFPGNNEAERTMNRYHTLRLSYRYLVMRGRPDLELE